MRLAGSMHLLSEIAGFLANKKKNVGQGFSLAKY